MNISALLILLFFLCAQFDSICAPDHENGTPAKEQSSPNPLAKARLKEAILKVIQQNAEKATEKREQLLKGMSQEERLQHMKEYVIKQFASGPRRREYISKVLARRDTKEYFTPKDIEGVVTFKDGRWEVENKVRDETVATILNYVEKRVNTAFANQVHELKMPLPQEGCKVVLNVGEEVKINAYMWELGLMFTENEVNEERQKISDLELIYKIGEEKFKSRKEAQAAFDAKKAKLKEEHEKKQRERKAKVDARKKELKLNRAKKMAEKKGMPIEAFLELSTYAIINILKYGEKALTPNAVIDFGKMPTKEDEKEEKTSKGLMKFLKEKLQKFYYYLKEHLKKSPEKRKLEEEKETKEKKINPMESMLRKKSDDEKKELFEGLDVILRTEDPEIETEDANDKKKDDAEEKKVFVAGEYAHFPHYEVTKLKVKPFDFLKDVRYNIYVKPWKKDFKKLKAKDFYQIVKFMTLCKSGSCDSEVYKLVDPKILDQYKDKINRNEDNVQNCYHVAQLFTKAIYYNPTPMKADPIREQFLGRLGAQTLNSVINAKKLTKEIGYAFGLSIGAAGGIAVGLNLFAWPAVILAVCGGTLGAGCAAALPLTIFLYSLTPAITETVDSFIIGKLIDSMKGGNFFPKSMKEFWGTLTDASRAGGVSAFGSVLNNIVFYYNTIVLNLTAGLFTNVIATATAGAMVPIEINKIQKTQTAALYMRLKQGFFPKPSDEELAGLVPKVRKSYKGTAKQWLRAHVPWSAQEENQSVALSDITEEEKELALFLYAKKEISFSMEVSKTSGLAINSLGIGSMISMVTYIIMALLDHFGVVKVAVSQVVNILVNQPTEVISIGSGTLTATLLGSRWLKGWVTTDAIKNEQVVDLIFKKTMTQMEKEEKNEENWKTPEEITSKELHYIYDTIAHKITNVWGKIINKIMNSMIDGMFKTLSRMYNIQLPKALKSKITASVAKVTEMFRKFKGNVKAFFKSFSGPFKSVIEEVKGWAPLLKKYKKDKVSGEELKAMQEDLQKGMEEKAKHEEDEDDEEDEENDIRNEINKISFYAYMDVCKYDMCYTVRSINISYKIETGNVTMENSVPVPYYEHEILPPAKIYLLNDTGYHATVYGDKYVFMENIDHDSDSSIFGLKFQSNGTRMFVNSEEVPLNETHWNCSIVPKQTWTLCVCKVHGHVVEFCSSQNKTGFDPVFGAYGIKHYNIYGTTKIGQPFDYYFKFHVMYGSVFPSCGTTSMLDLVQKKQSSARLGIGSNSSFVVPDLSVCGNHSGTSFDANKHDNFTVFMRQNTTSNENDQSWKLLVRFDWRKWVKNYWPGNCHYVHQMFEDGTPQDYCVCMKFNVTERFCNSYLQQPETSSSRNTVTLLTDTLEIMTTPYPEEPLSIIDTVESKQNISEEETNAFLEEIDALLSAKNLTQMNLSSLFDTLNSLMTKSCCNIHFVGNMSITAVRKSVECTKPEFKEWPVLAQNALTKPQNHKKAFVTSIWIPQESVCQETKENEEYVLIYYLFYNQALFAENASDIDNPECIQKLRSLSNYSPVLSAQLIRSKTKEHIHQILVDGKYQPMARIAIDKEEAFQLLPLHGSLKLAYWNKGKWKNAESARLKVNENYYAWEVDHLTDFTLVVDGVEMDPILCDATLDYLSIVLNFFSFSSLLILVTVISLKRITSKRSWNRKLKKPISKLDELRFVYYISLALFHGCFAVFSDSRNLFWLISCETSAKLLYWLLLVCIFITIYQSLAILKLIINSSCAERLLSILTDSNTTIFIAFGVPTVSTICLSLHVPDFFNRNDYFCWIRPDYILPAVILPISLLGINSMFTFFIILIRFLSQDNFIGVPFRFGSVRTIVWGSTSTRSTASIESTNSSISKITIGMKNMEKALVIFCVQLMLGIPWLCQYFTLFAPQLTLAHYVFTIVIGGHGMTFLILFWYRKLRKYCV